MMSNLNDEEQETGVICENCDSELLIELNKCPICGNELPVKGTVDKTENVIRKKITLVYNMMFWAEEFDINTLRCNEMISSAREQLEVGDLDLADKLINDAFKEIFDPLVESLEDRDKERISEVKDLLSKAVEYMKDEKLNSSLLLLKEYKNKLEENKSV